MMKRFPTGCPARTRTRPQYRHELKFYVDDRDLALIAAAIRPLTLPDAFHPEGAYRIRSVYYDDPQDHTLRENLDGTSPRSKYRIRIYSGTSENLHLEKKIKRCDLTAKKSCPLTDRECDVLLSPLRSGRPVLSAQKNSGGPGSRPLLEEFRAQMSLCLLFPAVVVEYERTAFTCPQGNVRITFDRNLAGSAYVERFREENMPKYPVLPAGQHLLEVKYDEFLPGYLRKALNLGKLRRTTFSKYAMCRMNGPGTALHTG